MLRFCGKIRRDIEETISKTNFKWTSILMISVVLVLEISGISLAVFYDSMEAVINFIFWGFVVCVTLIIGAIFEKRKKNYLNWDFDITINGEVINVIWRHLHGIVTKKDLVKVKKVIDYGDYYKIAFRVSADIICQKDLLIEGSIEEFEDLFAGKIVRSKK